MTPNDYAQKQYGFAWRSGFLALLFFVLALSAFAGGRYLLASVDAVLLVFAGRNSLWSCREWERWRGKTTCDPADNENRDAGVYGDDPTGV